MGSNSSKGVRTAKNLAYWSLALQSARERTRTAYRDATQPQITTKGSNADALRAALHVQEELQAVLDGNARMLQGLQDFKDRKSKPRLPR